MRTIGVEEELLLFDAQTARPTAVAQRLLRNVEPDSSDDQTPGGSIEAELQQQQIEIDTPPSTTLAELHEQVLRWRRQVDDLAQQEGARAVAVATSPLPVEPEVVPKQRYRVMSERFGFTVSEQLTCGCHVHVDVESPAEGVAVLDRIRVWLPVLVALSANSPFWQGRTTGYASYRSQVWLRFPTAGPTEVFGTEENYRRTVAALLATQVPMDDGMIYFDARLSARYPTVELRVADVCLDARDTVLIGGLARALVETAARAAAAGEPAPAVPADLIRMARWRASRSGINDQLLHPQTLRPRPASEVVGALLDHVRTAATEHGDAETLKSGVQRIFDRGTGEAFQRERGGSLAEMVLQAADVTRRGED